MDSCALAIALAARAAHGSLVLGHVVHDMRSAELSEGDARACEALAERLRIPFVRTGVAIKHAGGNPEGVARRERYRALGEMARAHGCGVVATAHHAGDQLETVLMRLVRGAGPAGLGSIAPRRRLDDLEPRVMLIRPMLGVTHEETMAICTQAGWAWREDHTNLDTTRLRSALRHGVIPALLAAAPAARQRAGELAMLSREIAGFIEQEACMLRDRAAMQGNSGEDGRERGNNPRRFQRSIVQQSPRAVCMAFLQREIRDLSPASRDRVSQRSLRAAAAAIRSSNGERREFLWRGVVMIVHGQVVELRTMGNVV